METKSINGKETKKHIAEALKFVFPGFKFSLTSEYDSVHVRWTDGPLVKDVQQVLNRVESYTRVLWKTDYENPTGYEWKGETYIGARYLNASRSLSDERRSILLAAADAQKVVWADPSISERVEIESELIREGCLLDVKPRNRPDLMREQKPVLDRRNEKPKAARLTSSTHKTADIIPLFSKKQMLARQKNQFYESLDAEQKFKLKAAGDDLFTGYDSGTAARRGNSR